MQTRVLIESEVRALLNAMVKHGRPAVIDWTNHNIDVLSEEKMDPTVILSNGPMTYREILFQINNAGVIRR